MKKTVLLLIAVFFLVSLNGCATYLPLGFIYTEASGGIGAAPGDITYSKVGISEVKSILGIVATGDGSIKTAAQNGGITKIKFVDYKVENILGVIGKYQTIVYGD